METCCHLGGRDFISVSGYQESGEQQTKAASLVGGLNIQALTSERFRRLSKESFYIVLGHVAAIIGALVGVRLLTELLDPAEYGELALGMTVATLVSQIVLGPLGSGVPRFYAPAVEQGDLSGYLNSVRRLVLTATGIILLVIPFTVAGLLIVGRTEWIVILTASLIFAILSGYNSILGGIQNAARHRSIVALYLGLDAWARFLVAAGLLLWLGANSAVAMVGYVMAALLVLGFQYSCFRKIVLQNIKRTAKDKSWRQQIWKYSWPLAYSGVFCSVQQASDRWALGLFEMTQDVGLYAVLFQLGYNPISISTRMAMQFFAPIFYQRVGDASDRERVANVISLSWCLTTFTLSATGIAFVMSPLFHTQIFQIFAGREYGKVSYLLPWVMLAGGVFAAGQTIVLNLLSRMKTQTMVVAKIITAVLGAMFNLAGAYLYGTAGIVIAGVLFSVSYFIWMLVLSIKTAADDALDSSISAN